MELTEFITKHIDGLEDVFHDANIPRDMFYDLMDSIPSGENLEFRKKMVSTFYSKNYIESDRDRKIISDNIKSLSEANKKNIFSKNLNCDDIGGILCYKITPTKLLRGMNTSLKRVSSNDNRAIDEVGINIQRYLSNHNMVLDPHDIDTINILDNLASKIPSNIGNILLMVNEAEHNVYAMLMSQIQSRIKLSQHAFSYDFNYIDFFDGGLNLWDNKPSIAKKAFPKETMTFAATKVSERDKKVEGDSLIPKLYQRLVKMHKLFIAPTGKPLGTWISNIIDGERTTNYFDWELLEQLEVYSVKRHLDGKIGDGKTLRAKI